MDENEFNEQFAKTKQELAEISDKVEMSMQLYEQVVERTQNFREGFYSSKKIRELGISANKTFQLSMAAANGDPEAMFVAIQGFVQNFKNIQATILTELDRIDK